jgi:dTDP-4-amino-4,6-dideoxygalactose transaminase
LINDPDRVDRAEIILEKGTNRKRFFQGFVDKYSWVDLGSSYVLSEINAAFLWAQLEEADSITNDRLRTWHAYHDAFESLEEAGLLRRPIIPATATHNAHMYYVLLRERESRPRFLDDLRAAGVHGVFHFVPLHASEAGQRFGRAVADLPVTDDVSDRLVRLPLWVGMTDAEVGRVVESVHAAVGAETIGIK